MQPSLQAGSVTGWGGTLASTSPFGKTLPVTVGAGSNKTLIFVIQSTSDDSSMTVKFNDVPMTLLYAQTVTSAVTNSFWYMHNPPEGTFDAFIGVGSWYGKTCALHCSVWNDVDQAGAFGTPVAQSATGQTTPYTATIAATADDVTLNAFNLYSTTTPTITPGTGQVQMNARLASGLYRYGVCSYKLGSSSSVSNSWTGGTSTQPAQVSVVLKGSTGGTNDPPTFPGPNIGNQTGTEGVALSANTISDSFSDTDALTFTAIGSWPPGVTVSSVGVISGTPTTAGTYGTLSVRATDTAAQTVDSDVFSFTIDAAPSNPAPAFIGPNIGNQTGTEGIALTANTVSDSFSDTDALTFTAIGTWPAGVTVSSAGVISGTPTTAGTYSTLKVRATDTAAQAIDSDTFSFTIDAAPVPTGTVTTPALKNNTGTVLASETGVTVNVYHPTTGVLVVQKTGLTTNGSGVAVITDELIVTGTTYAYEPVLSGGRRRLPTAVAT